MALPVQHDVSREFFAAVPPAPTRWGPRIGWALLLNLLRVPGMGKLLQRLRSG
jgi:hypothetical protein